MKLATSGQHTAYHSDNLQYTLVITRMASSFELSSEQPTVYQQRSRRLAASSYQNLFGEPTETRRPLAKKVSRTAPAQPRSRKQKPLPG